MEIKRGFAINFFAEKTDRECLKDSDLTKPLASSILYLFFYIGAIFLPYIARNST